MSELPFESVTPAGWATTVNSWSWTWLTDDHDRRIGADKRGPCPRCAHDMSISVGITQGITEGPLRSNVRCNCEVTHLDGQIGCGAHGEISVP